MINKEKSWYSKCTISQNTNLNSIIDWTDDNTSEEASHVMGPTIVDIDRIEKQIAENLPLEQGEMQTISEGDIEDYVVDDLLEQDDEVIRGINVEEGYFDGSYIPSKEELQERGIEPVVDDGTIVDEDPDNVPEFGEDHVSALQWAIDNNRVVKLSYLTLGKKGGRGGKRYLKRETTNDRIPGTGVNIWRIVEPHYIYPAKNGYDILVTYDRSVRHIRAFRLNNVTNIDFVKKRNTNEPSYFKPRIKIKNPEGFSQSGKIKGIGAMNQNIFKNLESIGDDLEKKGLSKTAKIITQTMSNLLSIKTAQYVGPQGYWIRQKRCWDNCYRHKRTTSPEKAAQVVWTECWDEYNGSINDNKSGWEKYAQKDTDIFKYANKEQEEWVKKENQEFIKLVELKTAADRTRGMSICLTLDQKQNEYNEMLIDDAGKLSKIAEKLKEDGQNELSEKIANVSIELLKEAQSPFGGSGVEGFMNTVRQWNPFSAKSRQKGKTEDLQVRIRNITQQALRLATHFESALMHSQNYSKNVLRRQQQVASSYNYTKIAAPQRDLRGRSSRPPVPGTTDVSPPVPETVTSQPPAYDANQQKWMNTLKSEFSIFIQNLQKETTELSSLSTKLTDMGTIQKATQASQKIMEFLTKASSIYPQMSSPGFLEQQGINVGKELRSFATNLNNISMQLPAQQDTNKLDIDRDNDGVIDNTVISPEQFIKIQQTIKGGQPLSDQEFALLEDIYISAKKLKSENTRQMN